MNPIVATLTWAKHRHLQHHRCYYSLSQKPNHKKSATTLVAKMAEDNLKKKNKKEHKRNKKRSATTLVAKMSEDKNQKRTK